MLELVTCYLLCLVSPWTDVRSLTKWKLLVFQGYLYHPWVINPPLCIQLTCLSSQRAYVEFYLRNYYDHSFHEHTSLGSPKGAQCLNPKRYYGAFIENTYCYHLPSTVTQSIGYIWSTYHLIVILLKITMRYQMFRFVTCYLLCLVFPWTDIHSLTK